MVGDSKSKPWQLRLGRRLTLPMRTRRRDGSKSTALGFSLATSFSRRQLQFQLPYLPNLIQFSTLWWKFQLDSDPGVTSLKYTRLLPRPPPCHCGSLHRLMNKWQFPLLALQTLKQLAMPFGRYIHWTPRHCQACRALLDTRLRLQSHRLRSSEPSPFLMRRCLLHWTPSQCLGTPPTSSSQDGRQPYTCFALPNC